jgi:hypothetical protein
MIKGFKLALFVTGSFALMILALHSIARAQEGVHGNVCRLDSDHRVEECKPITGTVTTWPEGTTSASSELSRAYRGQFGAPIADCAPGSEDACAARDDGTHGGYGGHGTGPGMGKHSDSSEPRHYRAQIVDLPRDFWRRYHLKHHTAWACSPRAGDGAPPTGCVVPTPQAIVLQSQLPF